MASGLGVPEDGLEGEKIPVKEEEEVESDFQEPCRKLCPHYSRGCSFIVSVLCIVWEYWQS